MTHYFSVAFSRRCSRVYGIHISQIMKSPFTGAKMNLGYQNDVLASEISSFCQVLLHIAVVNKILCHVI